MDRIITSYAYEEKGALRYCRDQGVAYQFENNKHISYDEEYFLKFAKYLDTDHIKRSDAINMGRIAMIKRHCGAAAKVLDFGVGSGEFIKQRNRIVGKAITKGFDVNPKAISWLRANNLWEAEVFDSYAGYTFFDTLEHVEDPEIYLKRFQRGAMVFVSIPIFKSLDDILESKHYRPNEHLYYFTEQGFIDWMKDWGYSCKEVDDFETKNGRDGILSFAFARDLPDWGDLIQQYDMMHSSKHYGSSSTDLLQAIAPHVRKLNPKSILDYGCGRSDLATYFYNDGKREIFKYDPAIPKYKDLTDRKMDLILCNDLMEHILKRDVERVIKGLSGISQRVIFSISTIPARAKLPNGMNAHVTIMPKEWWRGMILRHFEEFHDIGKGIPGGFLCKTFSDEARNGDA